jgi:putative membrane-bound dehydrogenase-like protein
MVRACRIFIFAVAFLAPLSSAFGQREFGFDNGKASGQPYLTPQESVKRMQVLPGYEITVFAAEPDVVNPIAFTIDERGRLWVVENFEYPRRTPPGKKPRDRIKILEDTDGDGKADKVTIWAEGKDLPIGWDLATGIEVGHGGVFLGAPPYLFLLQDTGGPQKKQDILLKGFGSHDTHETLNTFQWGPDSKLYGLHGVFTQSQVGDVKLNAAVWRYDNAAKKFDIFAEGTSNPWGMDFDENGQCFLACCVIPHLFHMVPGGTYKRQAGASFNPYAYGLLNEICDHTHHRESGWAHAGLLVLDGTHVPEPLRGSLIMGSIHGCSVKRDVLRSNGSTFAAGHAPDFLVSGDKNFRPINLRWGPDGSIYVIDWHDQNPCHQAAPDSWDKTHGRIYKIQRKGAKPMTPVDLGKLSSKELVGLLANDNPWWYRTALRLLGERRDRSVLPELRALAFDSKVQRHALRGLWGLHAVGPLDTEAVGRGLRHPSPWVRSWTIRLAGEAGKVEDSLLQELTRLAKEDRAPQVRLQLAGTARRLARQHTLPLLHNLMSHAEDSKDPSIPLMIWLAYETRVISERDAVLDWLKQHAQTNFLVTNEIVPRATRRLAATGRTEDLTACVRFVSALEDATRIYALSGLAQALRDRQVAPPPGWKELFERLVKSDDDRVRDLARRLAVNFQDPQAIARALALAGDVKKPLDLRLDSLRDVALAHPPEGLKVLPALVLGTDDLAVRIEACRTLAGYDNVEIARRILGGWKSFPPALRGEAVNLLAGRKAWAKELLTAVGAKAVPRTDLTDNTILRIRAFRDDKLNRQIETVWGRFRDTPAELNTLIEKMRGRLHQGRASFARGKLVFDNQCAKCHKFDGKGHEVGPNLDGAARDIEYLLVNVLDPNRVVGQPYYMRTVELKNGRVETGLLVAEDEQTITLKGENDVAKVIARKDIEGKVLVQDKSIMPEGLANNMTAQDFRDLVRYVMAHPFLTSVAVSPPMPEGASTNVDPLKLDQVGWTRPVVGPPGRISLPRSQSKTVFYIAAEATSPIAFRSKLLVGGAQPVRAWLNGKQVFDGRPSNGQATPDQAGVDVQLREGLNRLLFRVGSSGDNGALYARLLDPERRLIYPANKK